MKSAIELCKQLGKIFETEICGAYAVYSLSMEKGNQVLSTPQKNAVEEFASEVINDYNNLQKKINYIIEELEELGADKTRRGNPELRLLRRIREDIQNFKLPIPQKGGSAALKEKLIESINTLLS